MKTSMDKQARVMTIVLEGQDEIDQLFTIMNFKPIRYIRGQGGERLGLWTFLEKHKSSNYKRWHKDLKKIIVNNKNKLNNHADNHVPTWDEIAAV